MQCSKYSRTTSQSSKNWKLINRQTLKGNQFSFMGYNTSTGGKAGKETI